LLGGVRGGFMVPMHAQKRMKAFHEPTHCRPLPGGEQASVRVLSVPLPGGVRGGFMVPMHAQKRKEAFHEPTHSSSSSFSSSTFDPVSAISRTRPTTRTRTNQFMVPMHARKRKEALHESERRVSHTAACPHLNAPRTIRRHFGLRQR